MKQPYLAPHPAALEKLLADGHKGPLVMLNMLNFREQADYSAVPELAPEKPVSGEQAYGLYIKAVAPLLAKHKGELLLAGSALHFLIGPENQHWDKVLLIKQNSAADFLAFIQDPDYLKIVGHRQAALADSRLLPIKADHLPE